MNWKRELITSTATIVVNLCLWTLGIRDHWIHSVMAGLWVVLVCGLVVASLRDAVECRRG